MGIYDREYYRKEGPSYLESLIPSGQVCKWLIGINVLVFILQLVTKPTLNDLRQQHVEQQLQKLFKDRAPQDPAEVMAALQQASWGSVTEWLDLDTAKVKEGQVWRLVSYAFLHDPYTWMHIFFNMLFLWWFGSEIEQLYGSKEFLAFYLFAAFLGGTAFQIQAMVQGSSMLCVGASGAVTAVLVLYAFHYPYNTILLFFVLPVPIWLFVAFQVGQDAFHLLGGSVTAVAVSVHLGGAAFAALYYKYHWRVLNLWPGMQSWRRQRAKPSLRVFRPEEERVPVASGAAADLDEHLDAKLDAVLEKLSRHGRESLTESERDILLKASEIYKKKRT
jgi:membrane associated rhomboid family serine protease